MSDDFHGSDKFHATPVINFARHDAGKMSSLKQTPLTCSGHTRPVVFLTYSDVTPFGYFLISACKGNILTNFK